MLIYLAQLTHESENTVQIKHFPLAPGFIAAYLKKEFGDDVTIELFKRPSELSRALLCQKPDVFMLSNYMWNENLTCAFAKRAREVYPDVFIVVGGPNFSLVPEKNVEFLRANPAIDTLVHYEGELVAARLIRAYRETRDINAVKRLNIPSTCSVIGEQAFLGDSGTAIDKETRIGLPGSTSQLDDIPSPYLLGMFDKFFADGEVPLIETNRGCPFSCAFCQQGTEYFTKVRHFSVERVRQEVGYIAKKVREGNFGMYSLEIADPNFGMYNRDAEIVDTIRALQDEYGYPKNIGCSTGKNRAELIIENTFKLREGTILLRSAMQSTNPATLEAIKRQNIKLDTYREIQKELDRRKLENNADLMLGLPNETRESHQKAIEDSIDVGIKELACLQTIVLKGTTLERPDYRERYGIETKYRVIPECYGVYDLLGEKRAVCEAEEIIVKTSTMSVEDYKASRKLHFLVMVYHNTRLLSFIYDILDNQGIRKSEVIRRLCAIDHSGLAEIVNGFLNDTTRELFETFEEASRMAHVAEVTANKIFRHLSIALFTRQDVVVDALERVMAEILPDKPAEVAEIARIFKARIISPFEPVQQISIDLKSKMLAGIFGSKLDLSLSEKQVSALAIMNKIYRTPEDRMNKMAYHLRPGNLAMKVNSIMWGGGVLPEASSR